MDDLSDKLNSLLSSPDSMKQIEELMAAFTGASAPEDAPPPASPSLPDLGELGPLLELLPLLSSLNDEDDNAALLKALRPHLHEERQKRLDDAAKMMKMAKLLPLIKAMTAQKEGS